MNWLISFLSFFTVINCANLPNNQIPTIANQANLQTPKQTPDNLKIAFLGDSGDTSGFKQALELVKKEKAEATVHLGDMSYSILPSGPKDWNAVVDEVLGEDYPYVGTIGNHDILYWNNSDTGYICLWKIFAQRYTSGNKHDHQ